MRAFRFRLDAVLRYQQRRKKVAELVRQRTLQTLRAAEAEVVRLNEELRVTAEAAARSLGQGGAATAWPAHQARAGWLGGRLAEADAAAARARAEFTQAHEQYRLLAVAVETLVQLRQRRWEEHRAATAAEEQRRVDEIVIQRWRGIDDDSIGRDD